jgi:hypothetical protein
VQVVCITGHGGLQPGDVTEVPDGAEVSEDHFAEPGSPAAERAIADAKAAAEAREALRDAAVKATETGAVTQVTITSGETAGTPPGPGVPPLAAPSGESA